MRTAVFYCFAVLLWIATLPVVAATGDSSAVAGFRSMIDSLAITRVLDRASSLPPFQRFPGDRLPFTNVAYNRADGLFLGIGSDKRQALRVLDSSVLAHTSAGYSFGSHYWQVAAGLAYRAGERSTATIVGSEYYHHTDSHDGWKIPSWENSLHAFFAREDYLTWFRRSGLSLYIEQYFSRSFSAGVELATDRYSPLERSVSWSLFGGDKVFPDNPGFDPADLMTLALAVRYNGLPALPRGGAGVRIAVQMEKGWRDLSYEQWLAEAVVHSTVTPVVTLNSRIRLGSATGDRFVPKLFAIGGTGTMPGYAQNEYQGNRMALWNTELLLHGTAFTDNRAGTSLSLIFFCDIGYVADVSESDAFWKGVIPRAAEQWKSDIGIALGSANGRLRIGAAWRTDKKQPPSIVVRFSPSIQPAR